MDSSFLMPKNSAKFDRGHPLRGRQMQVGWVKIGDFHVQDLSYCTVVWQLARFQLTQRIVWSLGDS